MHKYFKLVLAVNSILEQRFLQKGGSRGIYVLKFHELILSGCLVQRQTFGLHPCWRRRKFVIQRRPLWLLLQCHNFCPPQTLFQYLDNDQFTAAGHGERRRKWKRRETNSVKKGVQPPIYYRLWWIYCRGAGLLGKVT